MFHGLPAGALPRFRRCNDPLRAFAAALHPLEANAIKRGGWRGGGLPEGSGCWYVLCFSPEQPQRRWCDNKSTSAEAPINILLAAQI